MKEMGGKSCNFPHSMLTQHTHFMLTQHMGGYQQDAGYLIPFSPEPNLLESLPRGEVSLLEP